MDHWTPADCAAADAWMEDAVSMGFPSLDCANLSIQMLSHLRAKRREQRVQRRNNTAASVAPINSALFAQASGFSNLANMNVARRTVFLPTMPGSRSGSSTPTTSTTPLASLTPVLTTLSSLPTATRRDQLSSEVDQAAANLRTVRNELHRYKEDGLLLAETNHPIDLLRFWEVCSHNDLCILSFTLRLHQDSEKVYPLMFKVALDILPAQASSVPCERIFSSSKETCTLRRNILSAALLEVRQVLKHLYKQERLDFMSQWVSRKEDYSIEYATETAINELVSSGKSDELVDLLRSMESSRAYWTFKYFASWTISSPPIPFFMSPHSQKKVMASHNFLFCGLVIYLPLFSESHRSIRCATRRSEFNSSFQLESTQAGPRQH